MKINTISINIHLRKLTQKSIINMNARSSNEIIETTIRRIRNDLIFKRDRKSKLRKTSFQLKRKWMTKTLEKTKMKRNQSYIALSWVKSSKVNIAKNKIISIKLHNVDSFASTQKVYSNDNDLRENVIAITIDVNWKRRKKLKSSKIVITHHEKWKKLIAKTKRLVDITTTNENCRDKTYKIYFDNQISLKIVKTMIATTNQARLRRMQNVCENMRRRETRLKLHWIARHEKVLENETTNRIVNKAHEITLSSSKRRRCEIATRLALIREQTKQVWKKVWKDDFNATHYKSLTSKVTHRYMNLHTRRIKSHSALLTQLRTSKIDFNQFFHERRVLDVATTTCECDMSRMIVKHVLLTCSKWKEKRKMMQQRKNITNIKKLLEFVNVATTTIRMILSTRLLNQF